MATSRSQNDNKQGQSSEQLQGSLNAERMPPATNVLSHRQAQHPNQRAVQQIFTKSPGGDKTDRSQRQLGSHQSNESMPVRSAQEQQQHASIQSNGQANYNYDFLYDPESANRSSIHTSAHDEMQQAQHNSLSPHVFMSSIENDKNDGRAKISSSSIDKRSGSAQKAMASLTSQRSSNRQPGSNQKESIEDEEQYEEEVYYLEEEIEEEGEEEVDDVNHHQGVEVIPEVDSHSEVTHSPSQYSKKKTDKGMQSLVSMSPAEATFNNRHQNSHSGPAHARLTMSSGKDNSGKRSNDEHLRSLNDDNRATGSFQPNTTDSTILQASGTAVFPFNQHLMMLTSDSKRDSNDSRQRDPIQIIHNRNNSRNSKKTKHSRVSSQIPSDLNKNTVPNLALMAEKMGLRMVMKELFVQMSHINDVFYRKKVQQEMILNNQSQMQMKTFIDISMSSHQLLLAGNSKQTAQAVLQEIKSKPNNVLHDGLKTLLDSLQTRLNESMEGEQEILHNLAKEKERNHFLETELAMRETKIMKMSHHTSSPDRDEDNKVNESELQETEQYVGELEAQLQNARQGLLGAKLELSDNQVEIQSLKSKLEAHNFSVNQYLGERKDLEDSFDNLKNQLDILQSEKLELTQMVRNRENTLATQSVTVQGLYNQSDRNQVESSVFKQETQKMISQLNKQVFDNQKRQESLELLEQSLLERIDKKDEENFEMKSHLEELRAQLDIKGDAISKAQKIIEKLNQKSNSDENAMQRMHQDHESQKREILEKQKVIQDLSNQLDASTKRTQLTQTQLSDKMGVELSEVRDAMREYQLEMESEKRKFHTQLNLLEDQLAEKQMESDQIAEEAMHRQNEMQEEDNRKVEQINDLTDALNIVKSEKKEIEDEMTTKYQLLEQNASSQIGYLQKRIKEVAEETQSDGTCDSHRNRKYIESGPMLVTMKKELDKLAKEVIGVRETIRDESTREVALVNQKLTKFDEFRLNVLDQLILWDEKTAELATLASRYYGALEEQKKLFIKLKLVVEEKDQMIGELQKQLIMREQSQETHFSSLMAELNRSNQVMREEFLETISLLERKSIDKEKQVIQVEERAVAFRQEYTQILEERNYLEQQLENTRSSLMIVERDLAQLQQSAYEQSDVYADILNIRSMQVSDKNIEHALRNLADENKRNVNEIVSIRDLFHTCQRDRDEEKQLLNQKLSSLEEQYDQLQKKAIDKEEEQQLQFVEKENELTQELQTAQAFADKCSIELQTRERQLKKLQTKMEEDYKQYTDLSAELTEVSREKMQEINNRQEVECKILALEEDMDKMKAHLKSNSDLLDLQREDINKERIKNSEKHFRITELEEMLTREEEALEKAKAQFIDLERKMKHIESKSNEANIELQGAYKEMNELQFAKNQLVQENKDLEHDIDMFKQDLEGKEQQVETMREDIRQYQGTVMRTTRELEENKNQANHVASLEMLIESKNTEIANQKQLLLDMKIEVQGPPKQNSMTQTVDSGMLELQYARQEVYKSQQCQEIVFSENNQLKEALQRSTYEVCRLIEDKRELEELIEKLNKSINNQKQQNQGITLTHRTKLGISPDRQTDMRSNVTSQNYPGLQSNESMDVIGQVLAEKENYIHNLEGEINEMRREIEKQRDHIDINTLQESCGPITSQTSFVPLGGVKQTITQNTFYQGHQAINAQTLPVLHQNQPASPKYLQNVSNPTIDNMLHQNKAVDMQRQSMPLRDNSRERQEQRLTDMPHKLHATYYSSLPSVQTLIAQPAIQIEDHDNQNYNQKYPQHNANNMTHGTANHNDTTVNVSQVNPMDNTYYTNHQGHGDASFLNNNLNASHYNTITAPPGQQNQSPPKQANQGGNFHYQDKVTSSSVDTYIHLPPSTQAAPQIETHLGSVTITEQVSYLAGAFGKAYYRLISTPCFPPATQPGNESGPSPTQKQCRLSEPRSDQSSYSQESEQTSPDETVSRRDSSKLARLVSNTKINRTQKSCYFKR